MAADERRQLIIDRLVADASRLIQIRAALICSAPDPITMVQWLAPVLRDPNLDGGAIPPIYRRIAEFEMAIRRSRSAGAETSVAVTH
jgi:hypothetical protein